MLSKPELRKEFASEWEKHYKLESLVQKGFSRQQCKSCKRNFWSQAKREVCEDSTCVGYGFIGNSPSNKKLSYVDTWREIEKYFVKNGHTSIKPYPTVARWRDDLYFTIASINDFQPYVVSGEMPPPANPLIVPQTCIRFSDLTNVGVTGRHYTNFVMFGQHAFNTKKTGDFYWKSQAVEHDINYLAALGIPEGDLVFIEDVWMGGGNFGPSMEYFCNGIELGNCVFMQYEILPDGSTRELSTKVIDMGAGLARLCWITHGSPTSYEHVFGPVIADMKKQAGVSVDQKLFLEYAKLSGSIDAEEGRTAKSQEDKIAKSLGILASDLDNQLRPLYALYAIADHISTNLFTITDGQLPSNAGGGYNLRLILRRAFGFNDEFGFNLDWAKIIEGHAIHLHPLFPHLTEGVKTTQDVVGEEIKKYRATQEKGRGKVASLVAKASKEKRQVSIGELTTLYVSDGIPPEMVEQVAKEQNLKIEIPDDFYQKLRHEDETERKKGEFDVEGMAKTEMLCYSGEFKFKATVTAIKDGWVVLDKTGFYAESGGQASDSGTLNNQEVLEVKREAGVVFHRVGKPGEFIINDTVVGEISAQKRRQITQHHSGAHVLNAAARDVLGQHVWQCGSHKNEEKAHLDLTHYRRITDDELERIELRANEIVYSNLPVTKIIHPRAEAEGKFGFRIYQGGAVPGLQLRIVSIADIDHQACGGTHVNQTGDIGMFKIVKRESVQDGVERVTFKCGNAAVLYVQEREKLLSDAAAAISVPDSQLAPSIKRFFEEWKSRGKQIEKMEGMAASAWAESEIAQAKKEGREKVEKHSLDFPQRVLEAIAGQISQSNLACVLSNREKFIVASAPDASDEDSLANLKNAGAKGGGTKTFARGKLA